MPALSVIAPCLNEQDNVAGLCERVLASFDTMPVDAELVLIDDGSKDNTWQAMTDASAQSTRVVAVRHATNKGIEGAWHTGLEAASGDLICLIDSDLQNRPEDIPRLYAEYERLNPHLVQAVRQPTGDKTRIVFSRALNVILNVAFGSSLQDNKSGFILCHRDVLTTLLQHDFNYRYFQSFIGAAASVRDYRIAEVQTQFERRRAGESFLAKLPVRASLTVAWELLKYRIETLRL